jgi:MFS family permease
MTAEPTYGRFSHVYRALRHRNFRLFFIGQIISWVGTWMQQVALGWLAYKLSNSALVLGLVTFATQAPTFLLSPFSGALVDRVDRRRLVVITQSLAMVQALVIAALTLTHFIQVWHLVVLGILLGVVNSADMPGRQSLMVHMVENKADLPNAIALNSSLVNAARLVGPTIAGFLIGWVGEGMCFLLNGLSYVAVIIALMMMRIDHSTEPAESEAQIIDHLKEGWRYALGFAPIRSLIVLLALVSLLGAPYTVLMPVFAKDVFHGGASTLGILMGAAGVGSLVGAIFLASRTRVPGLGSWVTISTLLFGAGLAIFAVTKLLWLAMIVLLVVGFGMMVQLAAINMILQTLADEDKRGRVMSLYTMAFMTTPFGGLAAGWLASHYGAQNTTLISGILIVICGLVFATQLPSLRRSARPVYIQKGVM